MSTLVWSEFSCLEAKEVDHAAFRVCYQPETQSLLLLYNFVDLNTFEEYWIWRLYIGKKYGSTLQESLHIKYVEPPLKWANKCLEQILIQQVS